MTPEQLKSLLEPKLLASLARQLQGHLDEGEVWTFYEQSLRELAAEKKWSTTDMAVCYLDALIEMLAAKLPDGCVELQRVQLEMKRPMPYEVVLGEELVSHGTADGFVALVGSFLVKRRNRVTERYVISCRTIGKPFYQYVPHVTQLRGEVAPTH